MTKSERQPEAVETNELLAFIAQNALAEGDKLPPERELASELGISRRALRHLLTRMELDGHIWRGRRNGTFLGRRTVGPISIDQRIVRGSPASVLETRLVVEPSMTAIAAVKASEADLLNIETCMRRTTEVRNDEDWIKWDGAFHLPSRKRRETTFSSAWLPRSTRRDHQAIGRPCGLQPSRRKNDAGRSLITARSATCCANDPPMMPAGRCAITF